MKKNAMTTVLLVCFAVNVNAALIGNLSENGGNLGLSLTVTGGNDTILALGVKGVGSLSNFVVGEAAPQVSEFVCSFADLGMEETYGQGELWTFVVFDEPYAYQNGVWLTAELTLPIGYYRTYNLNEAKVIVTAYETIDGENFTSLDSMGYVPEPITVALLSLGGLFVARKKK